MRIVPSASDVVADMGRLLAVHLALALMVCLLLDLSSLRDPTSPSTVREPDDTLTVDA